MFVWSSHSSNRSIAAQGTVSEARDSNLQPPQQGGEGDFSIHCCMTLSSANKKEEVQKLPLQPVTHLKHPAPSLSMSPLGSEEPENVPKATE